MKIIFSHGKESGPWGTKISALAERAKDKGWVVESIDYRGITDPDLRVEKLIQLAQKDTQEYVLVGSSMGGYVALMAAATLAPRGVFLLAPALYLPGYEQRAYPVKQKNVCIVHGWNDEIIPYQHSLRFAEQNNAALMLINDEHRLVQKLDDIVLMFSQYLDGLLKT